MSEPEPSLIQQRMVLDRKRMSAIFGIVASGVGAIFAFVVRELSEPTWLFGIAMVLFTTAAIVAVLGLRDVRRKIREFEGQHGTDAGVRD
ncbi:hypothetical protein [Microbacterium sp. NPDC089695]|uniref:hypothetical protein n=1 Tax=Microbacterium sp. NPDC089695 TaxID=3364198 RepID=UPI00382C8AB6